MIVIMKWKKVVRLRAFHSDESNKDEDDDDLLFDENVDKNAYDEFNKDKNVDDNATGKKDDKVETDENSVYASSDEERMTSNSTDEDELKFPLFNEDVDIAETSF